MSKSTFILDDEYLEIKDVVYKDGELSITTTNNYILNINMNFDISTLNNGIRENISRSIYEDQDFVTEKYSYVINIGNDVYLTKNNDTFLLEISIPKVIILIPPFDNINKTRLELKNNYDELEIHKLEVKIYFKKD